MATLSAHLRRPDAHAGLPFHPDCPICREERLVGALARGGAIPVRAGAALVAGMLAVGSAAPAALAAESDSQQDGTTAVTQPSGADSSRNPDFDPGGASDDLPVQAPALPQTQAAPSDGNDDAGAIDQQPAMNTDDPVVDQGDGSDAQSSEPQATTPTNPTDASQPSAQSEPTTAPTAPQPEQASSMEPTQETTSVPGSSATARRSGPHRVKHVVQKPAHLTSGAVVTTAPMNPAPAPTSSPAPVTAPSPTIPAAERAKPGDHTHTVRAGESLWSIASDFLGSDASTARTARVVNRLWQLNRERIGTGDPNLLMVGTTLRLR